MKTPLKKPTPKKKINPSYHEHVLFTSLVSLGWGRKFNGIGRKAKEAEREAQQFKKHPDNTSLQLGILLRILETLQGIERNIRRPRTFKEE